MFADMKVEAIENFFTAPAGHFAVAYQVPISLRQKVLAAYREAGIPVRLRYRGPRKQSVGRKMIGAHGTTYVRSASQAQHDCVLADATCFSVYRVRS